MQWPKLIRPLHASRVLVADSLVSGATGRLFAVTNAVWLPRGDCADGNSAAA